MLINPHYIMARRRAERYDRQSLEVPAYARKPLKGPCKPVQPKVAIGSGRFPGQQIELMPAIHTPPAHEVSDSLGGQALLVITLVVGVLSFAVVGW
ncbi:hypothetical protein [Neopusillimonas aromaticivorans]|uniref:hypothetical protein n=1 Tax=Neopusillimonas aromaticivorans TaxID=2979868 RepID=UPI002598C988|nr:hypothetical protein [Neopusillimonas aromaticivorans]WJJ94027.1 hypothetical protein N7E01_02275 [Neopusillimonas aromaticivorans]